MTNPNHLHQHLPLPFHSYIYRERTNHVYNQPCDDLSRIEQWNYTSHLNLYIYTSHLFTTLT